MRRQQWRHRRGRCSTPIWSRRDNRRTMNRLSNGIVHRWESCSCSWCSCAVRWHRRWDMKAIPGWQIWRCCALATPGRRSAASASSSSRRWRQSIAPIWRTFITAQKTAHSRGMSICSNSRRRPRRETGSRRWRALKSCTHRWMNRWESAFPICCPIR